MTDHLLLRIVTGASSFAVDVLDHVVQIVGFQDASRIAIVQIKGKHR